MNEHEVSSEGKMNELQKYIAEESEKIAGQVLKAAIDRFGLSDMNAVGAATDILAAATGRVASILAKVSGRSDLIADGISASMRAYLNNFEQYVDENNVAMEE